MRSSFFGVIALACSVAAGSLPAQQLPPAYPANGQSPSQQQTDKSACMSWAQGNATNQATPPPQAGPAVGGGQRAGGTIRGAAAGAAICVGGPGENGGASCAKACPAYMASINDHLNPRFNGILRRRLSVMTVRIHACAKRS